MCADGFRLHVEDPKLAAACDTICRVVGDAGGRALIVGGTVRDSLLGSPIKDIDFEVYGLAPDRLEAVLQPHFDLDVVGKSFGVFKLRHYDIDIAVPRRESKAGLGHRAFDVASDPGMSFSEAAARRDFTINAMGHDPLTGEVLDAYEGRRDLANRILRHTSGQFAEDRLRVLRAMQFAARFEMTVAPETVALCQSIEPEGLPRERIFEEWRKLILRGLRPSLGLTFLRDCGWVRYYPELEALIGCVQDPEWHPEGDVWTHTLHAMDVFAEARLGDAWDDLVVGFAVLCHDLGKPATTARIDGRIRSLGHAEAGELPTRRFIRRMTSQHDLIAEVVPLVAAHLHPQELYEANAGNAAVRRLARRVGRIDRLVRVAFADRGGRPSMRRKDFPAGEWLQARAEALRVRDSAPQPFVMGRHLIQLGVEPGPDMGSLLRLCFEAQLDGAFQTLEEGLQFAKELLRGHP